MSDVSARLPKRLSLDISKALGSAVRQTGAVEQSLQRRLKTATDDLERTIREFARVRDRIRQSPTPSKEQLEKLIHDRIPSGYRDKSYKRVFWRMVYRMVPFMQKKKKTEDEINRLSVIALTSFSVIFRSIVSYSNALLRQSASSAAEDDPESGDPDDFDPELDSAISDVEREVKPSAGRDQFQRKTDQNVKNQQRRSEQTSAVGDMEEFRAYLGEHEGTADASRVAVQRYSSQLSTCLKWSNSRAFSTIQASASKAADLSKVLSLVMTSSRDILQPGTYVAAKSLMTLITTTNTIVIQSVAQNRSQRANLNKYLRELQKGSEDPEIPSLDVED